MTDLYISDVSLLLPDGNLLRPMRLGSKAKARVGGPSGGFQIIDWNGKVLKIWKAKAEGNGSGEAAPGTVTAVGKTDLTVQTGDGVLRVLEVQLPGKKRMDTGAFLRGNKVEPGVLFTEE